MVKRTNRYKTAFGAFGLVVCMFVLCSCLSFNIADAPSPYTWPHNEPAENWCGPTGAFLAYYLMYYFGPGVFVMLTAAAAAMATVLAGGRITQPILRTAGLLMLVIAASSTWNLLWPAQPIWPYSAGVFPAGSGGVLGIAAANALMKHVAVLGTSIIIGCGWIVGAILLADTFVITLTRWAGTGILKTIGLLVPAWSAARQHSKAMAEIWKKLSQKQKQRERKTPLVSRMKDTKLVRPAAPRVTIPEYAEHIPEPEDSEPETRTDLAKKAESAKSTPPPTQTASYVPANYEDYELPPLDLLRAPEYGFAAIQEKMVERKAGALEDLLAEFGVQANVVNAEPGPAITMYELELAPGIKVSQISNLANDMARALGAISVRVVAPLAGRHTIGIEVPNNQREIVRIRDLIHRAGSKPQNMQIPLFLGKSSSGEALTTNLGSMPHLLIAGTTGSGKSVCINSIIMSVLLTKRPDEVKLILIDPKMVEMTVFETVAHLMCPIVTDVNRAEQILKWATTKMDERYELLAEAGVRNIDSYNKLGPDEILKRFQPSTPEEEAKIPKKMPHIVIIIDELADLMMTAAKEIEAYIVRLAQKSRAIGIHLVIATQRPQATVVTGLIKSNMPARISFRVASRMDSRIILDQNGGETLLGEGDMLFLRPGTSDLVRAQGAFVDDGEVRRVTKHLKTVALPQFHPELMQLNRVDTSEASRDELFDDAVRIVLETKRGSVSLLQRRLSIGYARASRIIEMMAAAGILGEYKGSQAREVTMTLKEYERMKEQMAADAAAHYADLSDDTDEEYAGVADSSDDEAKEDF
ncbi:MAG TPA: DNA translocase FtsK [Planctomycetes bacterium]|nr:DNA translocase FtsK [Planctomycetota bacterium]HIJ71320.1 DNA translocase FtsK [Planctomycetota bacterium]